MVLDVIFPLFKYSIKIIREFRVKFNIFVCARMYKSQGFCMQCLSGNDFKTILNKCPVFGKNSSFQNLIAAVGGIVKKRMPDIFHMRPDLVCPACFKIALQE